MMIGKKKIFLAAILGIFLMVFPVSAAINQISQGNTVFLGEQGLDVSSAVGIDNQIGWWASGAAIATSSPDSTYPFGGSKTSFAVTPTTFGSYLGTWYRIDPSGKANGTAFTVADPNLNLRVEDTTVGVDVTQNKWVYRGDEVGFRIETNLNVISSQRGTPATIAIKVQPPGGGEFSALVNSAGTHPIDNIAVTTSPQNTGPLWDTGNSAYAPGTYTIWAECNVNRMKDNYGVTGKTVSTQTSMRNTEVNPLIGVNVPTTSPIQVTSTPAAIITTTSTPFITIVPMTSPTTVVITATPTAAATSVSVTSATTLPAPVGTTPKKSPGFGILATVVSVALIAVLVLKKHQ